MTRERKILSRFSTRLSRGSGRIYGLFTRILLRLGLVMQTDSKFSPKLPIMKRCGITPIDV